MLAPPLGNDANLWAPNWEQQGKCSGLSIAQWFGLVVKGRSAFDMNVALAAANVSAGTTSRATILDAIQTAWGKQGFVQCDETCGWAPAGQARAAAAAQQRRQLYEKSGCCGADAGATCAPKLPPPSLPRPGLCRRGSKLLFAGVCLDPLSPETPRLVDCPWVRVPCGRP